MDLVKTDDFGIKGVNYYWHRKEMYNITDIELESVGVTNGFAYVDKSIIMPLVRAQMILENAGYKMIVKDGFRSAELYQLIYNKRVAKYGKKQTDAILNVITMPHSTGKVVDINLIDANSEVELFLRDKKDDPESFFVNFYKDSNIIEHREFHRLQCIMADAMLKSGFSYGSKKEFWHFEYC